MAMSQKPCTPGAPLHSLLLFAYYPSLLMVHIPIIVCLWSLVLMIVFLIICIPHDYCWFILTQIAILSTHLPRFCWAASGRCAGDTRPGISGSGRSLKYHNGWGRPSLDSLDIEPSNHQIFAERKAWNCWFMPLFWLSMQKEFVWK